MIPKLSLKRYLPAAAIVALSIAIVVGVSKNRAGASPGPAPAAEPSVAGAPSGASPSPATGAVGPTKPARRPALPDNPVGDGENWGGVPVPTAPATVLSAPQTQRVTPAAASGAKPSGSTLAAWGPPAAPNIDPRRFTEAHWQGLEVIPRTPLVAAALELPPSTTGVIVDDVTLPADLQGFVAGDLVTHVGTTPTPDLLSFIQASDAVRDQPSVVIGVNRNGQPTSLRLTGLNGRLGTANGETPSMIPPGARMPHPYRGPCTNCHRIGTTGTLPVDQGDRLTTGAPAIAAGSIRPHRDRGPCTACHQILP